MQGLIAVSSREFMKNVIEDDVGKGALSLDSKVDASACKGILLHHGVGEVESFVLEVHLGPEGRWR